MSASQDTPTKTAILAIIPISCAMIGFFFFTTQYLQTVLGHAPAITGRGFLPMNTVNFVVALQAPRLTARFGNSRLLAADLLGGLAGAVAGRCFYFSYLTSRSQPWTT